MSVETLRRWEADGRLRIDRSAGGQRLVPIAEVTRLLAERAPWHDRSADRRPVGPQPLPGDRHPDREATASRRSSRSSPGPHRMVSLMTAEAVDEMDLKVGDEAVCVVKATNVIVEIPSARSSRRDERRAPASPSSLSSLAACSGAHDGPTSTDRAVACSRPDRAPVELTVYAAASLKGALDAGQDRLRGGQPRHDARRSRPTRRPRSRRRSSRARRPTSSCRPTRRIPQKLVDGGLRDGRRRHVRRATSSRSSSRPPTRPPSRTPADLAKPGVKVIAAGDDVPITQVRDRSSSRTSPGSRATRPASRRPTPRTSCRRRTT